MSPTRRSAGRSCEIETLEAAALRKETMIHFRKIVVFGREPENRDGVYAAFGQFARHMNGRERLVNAVSGPAEQSDLLPGHHSDRAVAQPVQISRGRIVPAKRSILLPQDFHNGAANGVLEPHLAGGFVDSICSGRMAIKSETREKSERNVEYRRVVPGNSAGEIQLHSIRRSILVSAQQTRLARSQKALDDVEFVRIQTETVEGASPFQFPFCSAEGSSSTATPRLCGFRSFHTNSRSSDDRKTRTGEECAVLLQNLSPPRKAVAARPLSWNAATAAAKLPATARPARESRARPHSRRTAW